MLMDSTKREKTVAMLMLMATFNMADALQVRRKIFPEPFMIVDVEDLVVETDTKWSTLFE